MEKDNFLGVAQSAGLDFIAPTSGRRKRTYKMLTAGFYDGPARPVDPELRLEDMLTDGVDCEILYGTTGSGRNLKIMEVLTEVYRIYNDWVNQFSSSLPGRWYGLGLGVSFPYTPPNWPLKRSGAWLRATSTSAAPTLWPWDHNLSPLRQGWILGCVMEGLRRA